MIVSANPSHGRIYIAYRCPPVGDCTARASIMADKLDAFVGEWMKEVQAQGSYSANEHMATALAELAAARDDLEQAMRNLATFRGTAQARTILDEYQAKAEAAELRVDQLRSAFGPSAVRSMADWDNLSLAERRDLMRAIIKRILVRPGRGMSVAERVSIEAFLE
jgi:hypothetical protein